MKKKPLFFLTLAIFAIIGISVFYHTTQPPRKYVYPLAICTMFKNEAPWLKEWIEYHKLLGATKFYLYDNDSTDDFQKVLAPYIASGLVELIDWTSSNEEHAIKGYDDGVVAFCAYQVGAFNDCLKKRALGKAFWIAVIDVDEFIVPTEGRKSFQSLLIRQARKGVGALKLSWRIFGTSHVWDLMPDELLTEKLTLRALDTHPWNRNVKSLYRPEAVEICMIHEHKSLKEGYRVKHLKADAFRIHHYWTRTGRCLADKRRLSEEEKTIFNKEFNLIEDTSIIPFLPVLKKAVHSSHKTSK